MRKRWLQKGLAVTIALAMTVQTVLPASVMASDFDSDTEVFETSDLDEYSEADSSDVLYSDPEEIGDPEGISDPEEISNPEEISEPEEISNPEETVDPEETPDPDDQGTDSEDLFASAEEIFDGDEISVSLVKGEKKIFVFTPESDGSYEFYSESSSDTYGVLYDADKNEIINDDDSGSGSNFDFSYELTGGQTYYYAAQGFNLNAVDMTVHLTKQVLVCDVSTDNLSALYKEPLTLSVMATSEEEISYQWIDENGSEIEGANADSYTIEAGSYPARSFSYCCRLTSGNNVLEKEFSVTVSSTLHSQSDSDGTVNLEANAGEEITLSTADIVSDIENPSWSYGWEICDDETGNCDIIEEEGASYTFTPAEDTHILCYVHDGFSSYLLNYYVSVKGFRLEASAEDISAKPGSSQTVYVTAYDDNGAECTDSLTYTWKEKVYDMSAGKYVYRTIEDAVSSSLSFTMDSKLAGLECTATDGTVSKKVSIQVNSVVPDGEDIYNYGMSYYDAYPDFGSVQTLSVFFEYQGEGLINFQWYKSVMNADGTYAEAEVIEGATESTYDLTAESTARYICAIISPYDTKYCSASIHCDSFAYAWVNSEETDYGKSVTLETDADSKVQDTIISRQWYVYDTEKEEYVLIEGADSDTYTTDSDAMTKPEIKYMCEFYDGVNTCRKYASVYVNGPALNKIPNDSDVTIPYGDSLDISVEPDEFPDDIVSYEWYYYSWSDDKDIILEAGSDVKEITLTADSFSQDGLDLYCRVTTKDGFKGTACWWVDKEKSLSASRSYTKKIRYGTETTLSVNASTYTDNDITYQWEVYSDEQEDYVAIEGATDSSLDLSAEDTKVNHPDYRCIVSDGESSETLDFYLTVYQFKLSTEKTSYDLYYGHSCTLQVESDMPDLPLTYTWKYGSEVLGSEASLTLTNDLANGFTVPGSNTITCTAESEDGYSVKKTFYVWMEAPFYVNSNSPTVRYGEEVTLHTEFTKADSAADLTGEPSYQWYKFNNDTGEYEVLEGETSADLQVTAMGPDHMGYECQVTWNGITQFTYPGVYSYAFTYDKNPDTVYLTYGQGYTFDTEAKAFDGDPLSFTWYKIIDDDEEEKYETVEIEDAKDSSCSLSYEDLKDYDEVQCRIESESGYSANVNFYLNVPSDIKASACDYEDPAYGEPIDLKVKASSKTDGAALNYQWQIYDEEEEQYTDLASTSDVCTLTAEQTKAERVIVRCIVSDTADSEPSKVEFYLNPVRLILSADQTKFTVPYGEEAELAVSCNEDVCYTWYYGSKVLGEGPKLTVNHELLPEYRPYSLYVKAENSDGWTEKLYYYVDMQSTLTVEAPSYITLKYGETTDITLNPSSIAEDPRYSVAWSYYDYIECEWIALPDTGLTLQVTAEDIKSQTGYEDIEYQYVVSDGSSSYTGSVDVEVSYLEAYEEYSDIVLEGQDTDLKVNVVDYYKEGALTFEWVKWNTFLDEFEEVQSGESNVLHLTADQLTNKEMHYRCYIKDENGKQLTEMYFSVRSAKILTDADDISITSNEAFTASFNITDSTFEDFTYTWSYRDEDSGYDELGQTLTPSYSFDGGSINRSGYLRCRVASQADPSIYEDVLIAVYVRNDFDVKLNSIENHESDAAYDEAIKDDDNAAYVEEAEKNDFDVASAFKSFFAGFYDSIFGEASGNAEQLGRTEEEVQDENISLGAYVRKFFTNLREIMAENILGYVPGNSENETYKDDAEADTRANWNEYNGQDAAVTDTTAADKSFLTGIFGTFKSNVNTDGSVTGQTEEERSYFKAGLESGASYRENLKTYLTRKWAILTNNCSHENLITDPAVEATCTSTGLTEGSHCADCGKVVTAQEVIPKKAHTVVVDAAVAATCTEAGLTEGSHCSVCKAVFKVQDIVKATGHTVVKDAAVAATCTEAGLTEGSHCSVCKAVIKAQQEIKATGHTVVKDAAVAATCTEAGLTEGSHCSVCKAIIKAQEVIAASGHTVVTDAAVAATCTETGLTEGSHCSVCNAVIKAQEEVAATGHTVVEDAAKAPTCTEIGLTEGSHCSVCQTIIVAQKILNATGHTEVGDAAVAATCTKSGKTAGSHCSVCGEVIKKQEVVKATGHTKVKDEAVAATCTRAGKTEGSHCSVCNAVLSEQEEIPALGHTLVSDAAVAATCTTAGKTEGSHCSVCGTVTKAQEEIPALGHTEVTDAAVAATCTTAGKTAGSHCLVCGIVMQPQEVIKAKGHIAVIDKAVAATYTKTGKTAGSHCKVCGKVLVAQKTVAKLAKKTQTLTVSPSSITYKYAVIKKKAASFKISYTKAQGKVTFKSSNKNVTVTTKGAVTVKKGTKKGTYKITVTAAGNTVYKAGSKTVTIKVK